MARTFDRAKIPLWVKLTYTTFLSVLVPYYWKTYGPANFLWFCDVALLVALAALWWENSLLASIEAVAMTLPQALWLADLLAGSRLVGLSKYMFDPAIPLFVRGLSSFHIWLPFLLLWMVWRLGYDRRAWLVQSAAAWALLVVSFAFTDPPPAPAERPTAAVNVNWVFGPGKDEVQTWMPPELYLAAMLVFFPVCVYWPSHLVLRAVFPDSRAMTATAGPSDAPAIV